MKVLYTSSIRLVKKYWVELEKSSFCGFYQSYAFAKECFIYRKTSLSAWKNRNTKCCFAVLLVDKNPVCIAPLIVNSTPRKHIGILGHGTNAGYLDFIYSDPSFVSVLYQSILKKFPDYDMDFVFVPQSSPLTGEMRITEEFSNYSVNADTYDDWFSGLSKNTRQNIRTSYNRLTKDELTFSLKEYERNDPELKRMLYVCNEVYQRRKLVWHGKDSGEIDLKTARIFLKRDVIYQSLRKYKDCFLEVLYIDEKCSAFMICVKTPVGVTVPRLAINSDFSRYSPGMLLINEYMKKAESKGFVFDLCRGDEGYKKTLGGQVQLTYRLAKKQ